SSWHSSRAKLLWFRWPCAVPGSTGFAPQSWCARNSRRGDRSRHTLTEILQKSYTTLRSRLRLFVSRLPYSCCEDDRARAPRARAPLRPAGRGAGPAARRRDTEGREREESAPSLGNAGAVRVTARARGGSS